MAAKRRRRRKSTAHSSPVRRKSTARKRRRSRAVTVFAANPATRKRRRRRSAVAKTSRRSRRRRYSLNPSLGGIQRTVVEGMKDGATVFVAQVATRKASAAINGVIPAGTLTGNDMARGIVTRLVGAVAVTMVARKVAPARARLAAAGAFAEVVNFAVSQSPTATKFLSAFPSRRVIPRTGALNAWARPQAIAAGSRGMSAYPMRSVGMPMNVGV